MHCAITFLINTRRLHAGPDSIPVACLLRHTFSVNSHSLPREFCRNAGRSRDSRNPSVRVQNGHACTTAPQQPVNPSKAPAIFTRSRQVQQRPQHVSPLSTNKLGFKGVYSRDSASRFGPDAAAQPCICMTCGDLCCHDAKVRPCRNDLAILCLRTFT